MAETLTVSESGSRSLDPEVETRDDRIAYNSPIRQVELKRGPTNKRSIQAKVNELISRKMDRSIIDVPRANHLVYYTPNVPPVETTVRYSHSHVLPDHAEVAELITDTQPPQEIVERYDHHHLLHPSDKRGNVLRARKIVTNIESNDAIYVTSFQYAPVLSGFLSNLPWIVDVYDDPMQYALNHPRTFHEIAARLDKKLLSRADRVAAVLHPGVNGIGGENVRWIPNDTGFPVSTIDPDTQPPDGPLQAVWVGSPRLDRGIEILLAALDRVNRELSVHVFGNTSETVRERIRDFRLGNFVELHGSVDHRTAIEATAAADIGLCVLPPRRDWVYSYPVKVREYLAAGTVPVLSDFPSFRQSAREAGRYVEPNPASLASELNDLADTDPDHIAHMKRLARARAETYPTEIGRPWWARQLLHSFTD